MEDDREDGELSSHSDSNDDVNVYNPILRPDNSGRISRSECLSAPSDNSDNESSSSDSDYEVKFRPKRLKKTHSLNIQVERPPTQNMSNGSRKKNNIWANVLQEEELLEIGSVAFKKRNNDRSVESYDYTQALNIFSDKDEMQEEFESEENIQIRLARKRRFGEVCDAPKREGDGGRPRCLTDLDAASQWRSDESLAAAIATALFEQKPEIIERVVRVLGRERALELYSQTKKVELEGGVLIMNGSRRRTSGGVYLNLLKSFPGVDEAVLHEIFGDTSREQSQVRRRRFRAARRRQKHRDGGTATMNNGERVTPTGEDDGMHLRGLFSPEDPCGTKCPGSTPVGTPESSDNDDHPRRMRTSSKSLNAPSLIPLKEVCERAALSRLRDADGSDSPPLEIMHEPDPELVGFEQSMDTC